MFVVVMLVAVFAEWLALELNFIRERKSWYLETQLIYSPFRFYSESYRPLPFWRRWLGDIPYHEIHFPPNATLADRERVWALYPEATIY
jgi:hypothetical protein